METVLVSLASRPVGLRFGFCFSGGGAGAPGVSWWKAVAWSGRAARERGAGGGEGLLDFRRRFRGGERERECERGRRELVGLRERRWDLRVWPFAGDAALRRDGGLVERGLLSLCLLLPSLW